MNHEEGKKTKQEYLDNFEAVKGEEAREFIEAAAFAFASCDVIAATIGGKAPVPIGIDAMVELLSSYIALQAEKYGLDDEKTEELCSDARNMITAVTEASESRILRVQ